jgi:hypothetical protein
LTALALVNKFSSFMQPGFFFERNLRLFVGGRKLTTPEA